MGDVFGGDIASGPRLVLDDERLAELLGHELREDAADDVVGAARGEADDDADRLRRIGVGARDAWQHRRQHGAARKAEDVAAVDRHAVLPDKRPMNGQSPDRIA